MKYVIAISLIFGAFTTDLSIGQTDTVCFPLSEAKTLLIHAEKGYFCDSIIKLKDEQDSILRNIIESKNTQLEISAKIIDKQTVKVKRLKIAIVGAGVIGFILGLIF